MMKANAVFGIKASKNWKGKVYNARTKECYDGKTYTNIEACFRAYNSLEESVSDYFELITKLDRYKKAINTNSPLTCITAIKNGGYATSPSYITTIMNIIKSNNLTKYDVKIDKTKGKVKIINMYEIGKVYETKVDLNVRTGAGEEYNIKKYNDLTEDGKKHTKTRRNGVKAVLLKGTRVTCLDIILKTDEIWLKIPSGFICANYKGKVYIK